MISEKQDRGSREISNGVELCYPPALLQACSDSFDFALGFKNGTFFVFESARAINEEWVHIDGICYQTAMEMKHVVLDRGVDIRVSDIAWCCAAPRGS